MLKIEQYTVQKKGGSKTMVFHNEDFFSFFNHHAIQSGKAGDEIDAYVDVMAEAGITAFVLNTNARRTIYRSDVWDSFWDGYQPDGPDSQPFLAPISSGQLVLGSVAKYRNLIDNMLAVHQQGVDFPDRVIKRCRHHGITPWISLRMNDCHCNDVPDHPCHGSFWKNHPLYAVQNVRNVGGYFATCLDYARQEVRDYFRALVVETLNRYDIDGLELDFMREPYVFSRGRERECAPLLTAWIREIHQLVADAGKRRGHPIRLGIRVPSWPAAASGLGLDVQTWGREHLLDLLVVTPRWHTLEFDMPIRQWREILGEADVMLAGGLEVHYRPHPTAAGIEVSPELATGAAISVLEQGADAVYLFNYFQDGFWERQVFLNTLPAMTSLELLRKRKHNVAITYRDVTAPDESYQPTLPASGAEILLPLNFGPIPNSPRACELFIALHSLDEHLQLPPNVFVNGNPCAVQSDIVKGDLRLLVFRVPFPALTGKSAHEIRITCGAPNSVTVERVELSLGKSDG